MVIVLGFLEPLLLLKVDNLRRAIAEATRFVRILNLVLLRYDLLVLNFASRLKFSWDSQDFASLLICKALFKKILIRLELLVEILNYSLFLRISFLKLNVLKFLWIILILHSSLLIWQAVQFIRFPVALVGRFQTLWLRLSCLLMIRSGISALFQALGSPFIMFWMLRLWDWVGARDFIWANLWLRIGLHFYLDLILLAKFSDKLIIWVRRLKVNAHMVLQLLALLVSFATVRLWADVRKLASLRKMQKRSQASNFTQTQANRSWWMLISIEIFSYMDSLMYSKAPCSRVPLITALEVADKRLQTCMCLLVGL